jgi:hypothetical protein
MRTANQCCRETRMRFHLATLFVFVGCAAVLFRLVAWLAEVGLLIGLFGGAICLLLGGVFVRKRRLTTAGLVVLGLSIISIPLLLTVALGIGYRKITVVIVVVDENSGTPVQGATVKLTDADFGPKTIQSVQTDTKGRAKLNSEFPISTRSSLISYEVSIHTGGHSVQINAKGYIQAEWPLDKLIEKPWHPQTVETASIVVHLRPLKPSQ